MTLRPPTDEGWPALWIALAGVSFLIYFIITTS